MGYGLTKAPLVRASVSGKATSGVTRERGASPSWPLRTSTVMTDPAV